MISMKIKSIAVLSASAKKIIFNNIIAIDR
jgi:hypothetical protein